MKTKVFHDKPLIILDLDETLVYTSLVKIQGMKPMLKFYHSGLKHYIYKRPYIEEFLKFCFENFDVAVWTAAEEHYARMILDEILKMFKDMNLVRNFYSSKTLQVFTFTRNRCIMTIDPFSNPKSEFCTKYVINVKDLKKVFRRNFDGKKYDKRRTLVIDDTRGSFSRNYGNGIHIKEFKGNIKDDELDKLVKYIGYLLRLDCNWRSVDKRNWVEFANLK
jgi:hypothetical protein